MTIQSKIIYIIALTLNILSYTCAFLFIVYPKWYTQLILINIVMPIIGIIIYIKFKDFMQFNIKKEKILFSSYALILMPSLALVYRAWHFNILYNGLFWIYLLIGTFSIFSIFLLRKEEYKEHKWVVLFPLVIILCYVYGVLILSNCFYDNALPKQYSTNVEDKQISKSRYNTTYYLTVAPWGPVSKTEDISVTRYLYENISRGERINVLLAEGGWGIPWFVTTKDNNIYEGKALYLYSIGRYREALTELQAIYEKRQFVARRCYGQSISYSKTNRIDQAIGSLNQAIHFYYFYQRNALYEDGYENISKTDDFIRLVGINVKVNGQETILKPMPITIGGRVYLPLSTEIAQAIGFNYSIDKQLSTINITYRDKKILLHVNDPSVDVNGEKITLDSAAVVIHQTLFIPEALISKGLGAMTSLDFDNYTFYITNGENPTGYSNEQMEWALAIAAIPARTNNWRLNIIGGELRDEKYIREIDSVLRDAWNITDRESAIETLRWLKEEGHRKDYNEALQRYRELEKKDAAALPYLCQQDSKLSFVRKNSQELGDRGLLAWDYCRVSFVAGMSYVMGYLTYEEAWEEIMNAARILQKNYSSWEELGRHYMLGGEFWAGIEYVQARQEAYNWLRTSKKSPWVKIKWDLSLEKGLTADYRK